MSGRRSAGLFWPCDAAQCALAFAFPSGLPQLGDPAPLSVNCRSCCLPICVCDGVGGCPPLLGLGLLLRPSTKWRECASSFAEGTGVTCYSVEGKKLFVVSFVYVVWYVAVLGLLLFVAILVFVVGYRFR